MMVPLLTFATIILTISCLLGLSLAIRTLVRPSSAICRTERLQLRKIAGATLLGVVACTAGLFAAYEISIGIFVLLAINLFLLIFQFFVYRLK